MSFWLSHIFCLGQIWFYLVFIFSEVKNIIAFVPDFRTFVRVPCFVIDFLLLPASDFLCVCFSVEEILGRIPTQPLVEDMRSEQIHTRAHMYCAAPPSTTFTHS